MPIKHVVLFEDEAEIKNGIVAALEQQFKNSEVRIQSFMPEETDLPADFSYEDGIKQYLANRNISMESIGLFITDFDLSKTSHYPGLSEDVITRVANNFSIPNCVYARGRYKESLMQEQRWSDSRIILEITENYDVFASNCKVIFNGFEEIRQKYNVLKIKELRSPAQVLSNLLGKQDIQGRFNLYSEGDKQMLARIMPFYHKDANKKINTNEIQQRFPRILGYWLWGSILRYPGIVVNQVAAESYLGISQNALSRPGIRNLFRKAEYNGPFAGINGRALWWRDTLDEILEENKCSNGLIFIEKNGIHDVSNSRCLDAHDGAGYYCMINQKPVCEEHSRSDVSWFPAGADLARISEEDYEELSPWLGFE